MTSSNVITATDAARRVVTWAWVVRCPVVALSAMLVAAAWSVTGTRPDGLVIAAVVLVLGSGYATSDIIELPGDRVTAPHRPLPSGAVSVDAARRIAGIALVAGLGIALGLRIVALVGYLGGYYALFAVYSRWLRSHWVTKELVATGAFASLSFVPVLAGAPFVRPLGVLAAQAAVVTAGRELLMDLRDGDLDRVVPGVRRPDGPVAVAVGAALVAVGLSWLTYVWLTPLVALAIAAITALVAVALRRATPHGLLWCVTEALKACLLLVFGAIVVTSS